MHVLQAKTETNIGTINLPKHQFSDTILKQDPAYRALRLVTFRCGVPMDRKGNREVEPCQPFTASKLAHRSPSFTLQRNTSCVVNVAK